MEKDDRLAGVKYRNFYGFILFKSESANFNIATDCLVFAATAISRLPFGSIT